MPSIRDDRNDDVCLLPAVALPVRSLLPVLGFLAAVWLAGPGGRAVAYTPDDPQIIQMVDRGLRFLEQNKPRDAGEQVLCAYTHFKVEHDESNPVVKAGLEAAKKFAAQLPDQQSRQALAMKSNYEIAVATMLFCEVSPTRFRNQLATFQRFFNENQMPHGGYGYPKDEKGDVSQTQYAILAIWTLDRHGFKLDYNRLVRAIQWLLAVQDVRGPWPYHGVVPPGGGLIRQSETGMSMALAGAATLLIAGDAARAWGETTIDQDTGIVGLPKAIKLYKEDVNAQRRKQVKVSKQPIFNAIERMERWRQVNPERFGGTMNWYFYTVYTTERYESFIEIARGLPADSSPAWYNEGVNELMKMQADSGGWEVRAHTRPEVSTAFAILFLIRSTQRALGTAATATTIGGQGFAADVSKAKLVNGKAVTQSPAKTVAGMLDLLEGDGSDELDGKALDDRAVLATDQVERAAQLDRLERLVRGSKSWQARRVAARLLGTSDDLRVVPALIFALSDPDKIVRNYARDGLRFISRKFEGFGMPDEPSNVQLRQAQRNWRQWYLTMKPGYVFLDE